MTGYVYRERMWLSPWVVILFVILIVAITLVAAAQMVFGITIGNGIAPNEVLVGLDAIFIILLVNFSTLRIELSQTGLRLSYGMISKAIPLVEITSCSPVKAGFWMYGGMGIRVGADESLAFTTDMGKAVKILRKSGRSFVFSTRRPVEVANIINEQIKNSAR